MLVEKIKITESLRDYIERLHYESVRYKDLLNVKKIPFCIFDEIVPTYITLET